MSLYDFLFGKTTYKGDQYRIENGLTEEVLELPAIGGRCIIFFGEVGAKGIGFQLPPGAYRLFLGTDNDEEFLSDLTTSGTEGRAYLPLSVELIDRAELIIRKGGEVERIPLW